MDNIFHLNTEQLKDVAAALQTKISEGLKEDGREIKAIPTYINPKTDIDNKKALVLDLGGTNFRATVVEFKNGKTIVYPGTKKNLEALMKQAEGCDREVLFAELANMISSLKLEGVKHIGYCFSYPGASMLNGDAKLLHWTKGVTVKGMEDEAIGVSLMDYLNKNVSGAKFTDIKVINDTVASLFSGLTDNHSQAHIGLIVGTGTNMATFFPTSKIPKLDPNYKTNGLVPINLESGNFFPPHLTVIDDKIDKYLDSMGKQRFEKAISGMYLGRILEMVFSTDEFEQNFDASKLTAMMSYPSMYKQKYVEVSHQIYERSAKLVAASLVGLILVLAENNDKAISDIRLSAEGSLFWSTDRNVRNASFISYKDRVIAELQTLLKAFGHNNISIHVEKRDEANLIGSAIAALS
jgi:hexokinase